MKAKVYSHNELIGNTELKVGDETMGGVFGVFVPTEFYLSNLQKDVWDFWHTNKPNYKKWNELRFNVQLDNGIFLFPQGGFTIDDLEDLSNEPLRIDIVGVDSEILQDFFLTNPPRPFVEEPWNALQIEQKITFENELKKELGNSDNLFFKMISEPAKQILINCDYAAFCYNPNNDDVLFEIRYQEFDKRYALINLTTVEEKDKKGCLEIAFYSTFDEFKYLRMHDDKAEWED